MKVLLTGASGFLGSHLARGLLRGHHTIVALKRTGSSLSRLADLEGDIAWYDLDRGGLERAFREQAGFEAVIHTATCYGRNGESDSTVLEANTVFPLRLLELAAENGVGLFLNTDTCFNNGGPVRYSFLQSYSLSKQHFAEWGKMFADGGRIRFINMKLQHPYGPGDDPSKFVPSIIRQCLTTAGEIKLTPGEQKKDFVYVDDVVAAYLTVLGRARDSGEPWQEYECGTGAPESIRHFVETVHRLTASRATLAFGALPYRKNEIMHSCADTGRLQDLGWSPRHGLTEGLAAILRHDHGLTLAGAGHREDYAAPVR